MRRTIIVSASFIALAASITAPRVAHAQDAPAEVAAEEDEIIVTARRSAENIQSTPVSITAFDSDSLRDAGVKTTADLMVKTPGVYFGGSGGRENSTFQIRGQSKARSGFNAPAVVAYFADVPLPTFGSGVPTFDISSVQVLKGPQGTLFGRNTTGGAILFYPTAPTHDISGYIEAGYGNYDNVQLQGALNLPIIQDKVALRLSGMYDKRDGWTRDITNNVDLDGQDARGFRASLLLEPADGVKNVTTYDLYTNRYNSDGIVLTHIRAVAPLLPGAFGIRAGALAALARQQARGPRIVESDARPFLATRRQGVSNRTDIDVTDNVSITNIFGYRRTYLEYYANSEGLPALFSTTIRQPVTVLNGSATINTEQYSNELQLKGNAFGDRVDWLVGGFYLKSKPFGPNGTGSEQFSIGANNIDRNNFGYNFLTETSKAVFGSLTVKLMDDLKLNLGGRYTWDKASSCTANDTTTQGALNPVDCASRTNPAAIRPATNRTSSKAPTWQASLEWQATPDAFLYVASRHGYRAGGINAPTFSGRLAPFQSFGPEKVTDVELGFRTDWRFGEGVRFRLNGSAYSAWYSNVQFSLSGLRTSSVPACVAASGAFPTSPDGDCNPTNDPINGAMTIAAGKTRVSGVDIDGFIALGDQFKFTFAGNLLDPKSKSLTVPAAIAGYVVQGTQIGFDFFAKSTYSLGAEYTLPLGDSQLTAGADLYHSSKLSFVDAKFPSYSIVNARLNWVDASEKLDIGLYAKNLFNKTYIAQGSFNGPAAGIEASIFGAPRQYGVTLRYKFDNK